MSDGGIGYENKERSTTVGINTFLNSVKIKNHGYASGEEITYSGNADGLSSNQTYIVTKVDKDEFKLSSVGLGTTSKLCAEDLSMNCRGPPVSVEELLRNLWFTCLVKENK